MIAQNLRPTHVPPIQAPTYMAPQSWGDRGKALGRVGIQSRGVRSRGTEVRSKSHSEDFWAAWPCLAESVSTLLLTASLGLLPVFSTTAGTLTKDLFAMNRKAKKTP